jgi:hypothetical protein
MSPDQPSGCGASGQQRERLDMSRAHDTEVTPVERRDLDNAETFGNGDQARVDTAETEIGIALDEFTNARPVTFGERLDMQLARRDRAVELGLGCRAELPVDEPAGLSYDERGGEQRAGVALEELLATIMVRVRIVGDGDDDVGVDEKGQEPNPSASMSSSSAARRPLVDRPRLANRSLRGENCSAMTSPASRSGATPRSAASRSTRSATSSSSSIVHRVTLEVYELESANRFQRSRAPLKVRRSRRTTQVPLATRNSGFLR